ncbi:hypothetical protein [Tychonema sp. LEGE 07203]|uniref:hypothetical protein n=1 Tax=Tychonema sp. LEGE 07203 TaxID=1828671 RepID=UPI001881E4AC|nr:hypothetical protein [Tychonema sp. LEGE 07203]MBE9093928.1 hypothetical protein [Tychonema sp. LEGE 07203]
MMQIRELWQELDDEQAENISGGDGGPGCLTCSIGLADVLRPSSSSAPNTDRRTESRMSQGAIFPPTGKIRGTLILP